jgi:hypothetical protein|tara:strand:+ start:533 stop:799 length:267 start_codon:yes stop_codon:yes gene_type:complete
MKVLNAGKNMSYYGDSPAVQKIVSIGREMITLAETNKLFPKDDLLWNAAVTAGNKMVTAGTTYTRFKDVGSLTPDEKTALLEYLDQKG